MDILIADDQPEVCSALQLLLEQETEQWRVAGQASSVSELVSRMKDKVFRLLLLDWELPGFPCGGQSISVDCKQRALSSLRKLNPNLKVVVLSGLPEARLQALEAGADAFVSKGDPPENLLTTLYSLQKGASRPSRRPPESLRGSDHSNI